MDALIRAAGGVLGRLGDDGPEFALVHRPRLDDWSLPKGKLHKREHPVLGARREVWEETGVRPVLTGRLPTVSYEVLLDGRPTAKTVQYFAMRVGHDDGFTPGRETDELIWLPVDQAMARLSYDHDAEVVRTAAARWTGRAPVVLIRHASAGDPARWRGPDGGRPLDRDGTARAAVLAAVLAGFAPERLISATPRRCVDTLAPLAAAIGRTVEVVDTFDEGADVSAAVASLTALAHADGSQATVICSQGKLIPPLLAHLSGVDERAYRTAKGGGWLLTLAADGSLAALDPLD